MKRDWTTPGFGVKAKRKRRTRNLQRAARSANAVYQLNRMSKGSLTCHAAAQLANCLYKQVAPRDRRHLTTVRKG